MANVELSLQHLECRAVPAGTKVWDGGTSRDWNTASNWVGGELPQSDDVVKFIQDTDNHSKIDAGHTVNIAGLWMTDSCTFDLTVDGTLVTKWSNINSAAHGVLGSGRLCLDYFEEEAHHWWNGFVKTRSVFVQNGGQLYLESGFDQIGPDSTTGAGNASHWKIGYDGVEEFETPGYLFVRKGLAVGMDSLTITATGEATIEGHATFSDVGYGGENWNKFVLINNKKFEILEGFSFTIQGGWFSQTAVGTISPTTILNPGTEIMTTFWDGVSNGIPDYSISITAGKLIAYESAAVTARTDIKFANSAIEFRNGGNWTKNVGMFVQNGVSQLAIKAQDVESKEILITNTPVKFIDWNPDDRYQSATQSGGIIMITGKLKLDGAAALHLRTDFIHNLIDKIVANDSITMDGSALSLSVDLRNTTGFEQFLFDDFLLGTALTAPNAPFGGGVTITGDSGWSATINKDEQSLELVLF